MTTSRERILGRIGTSAAGTTERDIAGDRVRGDGSGGATEAGIEMFISALEKIGGRILRCTPKGLPEALAQVFPPTERVFIEPDDFLSGVPLKGFQIAADPAVCDGAITVCDALIAETGTVVLAGGGNRKRAASLITRTHCVVARAEQCVATMEQYLGTVIGTDPAWHEKVSALTFITGSSRTADIEKVLIRGMHGPKELIVVIISGN